MMHPKVKWRLDFIRKKLDETGRIVRLDITNEFGISKAQASVDIGKFISIYPGSMVYNSNKKCYYKTGYVIPKETNEVKVPEVVVEPKIKIEFIKAVIEPELKPVEIRKIIKEKSAAFSWQSTTAEDAKQIAINEGERLRLAAIESQRNRTEEYFYINGNRRAIKNVTIINENQLIVDLVKE